ncbi:DUF1488 domain-containing protein [Azospirillum baldaniorum]|uniref:DUF1488 domain-containing protein n=1 Tax=Azospirillum baldaniorum TaxID=1064539 RepID=A0A9P1NME6_9PROT|nr:DUF1488 family protein [Azospirillum baldaniorum]AWJ89725.1 DUF1488 domain-containing protein [Azospirillum baldaniorum]TWA76824.1 uncharacterized protein DUF1488 [Azospirillum brasilense]CCC98542.1 protein of unknown function [Azospirillum baldaniorum]
MPLFMFPDDPSWNEEADAVEFAVEVGEYHGRVFVPRRALQTLAGHLPKPDEALQYVCLNRPVFDKAVEARIMDRKLDPDANVHLTARDVRRVAP